MSKIKSITSHPFVNSRAEWTIGTKVTLEDGSIGVYTVPQGASAGEKEAIFIEPKKAIKVVTEVFAKALIGQEATDQNKIDSIMMELDGTDNKSNLGGNSILSVSMAVAKAAAQSEGLELYQYIARLYGNDEVIKGNLKFPTPVFNILNGGKHAQNNLSFQEFMVIPAKTLGYDTALHIGVSIYNSLKRKLHEQGYSTGVGDEGGFAPQGFNVKTALKFVKDAASEKYEVGKEVFFGMDVAADSFKKDDGYFIAEENLQLDSKQLMDYYADLVKDYELIYLEDPMYERDIKGWELVSKKLQDKLMVVADDLTVTNPQILDNVVDKNLANAVIVKPNQVGSLSETLQFIKKAKNANMEIILSHRSGETGEDTSIADIAVGVSSDFIKTGAPARGERVEKYNRLLDICYYTGNCSI